MQQVKERERGKESIKMREERKGGKMMKGREIEREKIK